MCRLPEKGRKEIEEIVKRGGIGKKEKNEGKWQNRNAVYLQQFVQKYLFLIS